VQEVHAELRGGTRIAVGSHEPFIGDVISNIRPHEQKSRRTTLLNGFAMGEYWKRFSIISSRRAAVTR
jgi:hypothetical protein